MLNGCPPPRVAAARQPWAMEDFPFREWLGRMSDFALLEMFCDRMRMGFRSRRMDCPLGRGFAEGCPVERTRRSGPPPPVGWALLACGMEGADWCFRSRGVGGPGCGFRSIHVQRSGQGSPPPRHRGAGSTGRVVGMDADWEFPIQVSWQPMGSVFVRSRSSGADTEVRAPASRVPGPFRGRSWWGTQWVFPIAGS